jgi:FixJ family two-component response regulator
MFSRMMATQCAMASPLPSPVIYLVEDDEGVRRGLEFELELAGLAVEPFSSGEALLQHGMLQPRGCLVIDERLPAMSGLETLLQLRARGVLLPAILITTHPRPALRDAAAQAGAPILEKPFDGAQLVAAIHSLLNLASR